MRDQPSLATLAEAVAVRLLDRLREFPEDQHPRLVKEAIEQLREILDEPPCKVARIHQGTTGRWYWTDDNRAYLDESGVGFDSEKLARQSAMSAGFEICI